MSFEENLWKRLLSPIDIDAFPILSCPSCRAFTLNLDKKSIRFHPLKKQYEGRAFELEDFGSSTAAKVLGAIALLADGITWRQCRFNGHLVCDSCGEITLMVGKAKVPGPTIRNQTSAFQKQLMPEYFSPPISIISLSQDYPSEVRKELGRSFSLFFSDASSAGNRIRRSIEILLDELNVSRVLRDINGNIKISSTGKEINLSLGKRLEEFSKKHPDYAEMFLAIKGVGNEGSHGSDLSRSDLLLAYKILDYILDSIYIKSKRHAEVLNVSKSLKDKYKNL